VAARASLGPHQRLWGVPDSGWRARREALLAKRKGDRHAFSRPAWSWRRNSCALSGACGGAGGLPIRCGSMRPPLGGRARPGGAPRAPPSGQGQREIRAKGDWSSFGQAGRGPAGGAKRDGMTRVCPR
jgi:hypothetical protein